MLTVKWYTLTQVITHAPNQLLYRTLHVYKGEGEILPAAILDAKVSVAITTKGIHVLA